MVLQNSIKFELNANIFIAVAILLAIGFIIIEYVFRDYLSSEFDRALHAKAMLLVTLTTQEEGEIEFEFAEEFMPEYEAENNPEYFQIWDGTGGVLERSQSLSNGNLAKDSLPIGATNFGNILLPDGRRGRLFQVAFVPHLDDDDDETTIETEHNFVPSESLLTAHFSVAKSIDSLTSAIWLVRWTLIVAALAILVCIVVIGRIVIQAGLQPLNNVVRQVRDVEASNLSKKLEISESVKEIDPIVEHLNEMFHRIEASMARERRFSGNVAHELRTPVAAIRTISDVGTKWPTDVEMVKGFFSELGKISLDMEHTITNLLLLARYETGDVETNFTSFSLKELVQDVWSQFPEEVKKNTQIISRYDGTENVVSDREKVGLIIRNLIQNALSYGISGEPIEILVASCNNEFALTIKNKTNSLSIKDLPLLFDRFWRKDAGRTGSSNAGLGLSLVKALGDVLSLDVNASLPEPELFEFSICSSNNHGVSPQQVERAG